MIEIEGFPSLYLIIDEIIYNIKNKYDKVINRDSYEIIEIIYDYTYNVLYQYIRLLLEHDAKQNINTKYYQLTNINLSLDEQCAYNITQFIYFDIYLKVKNINTDIISLSF
jgi:hypothetical protein|tara:strand:- start:279 stop:611 length:333 start_codon:yes stop_codon:yes gene_type:complete